MSKKQVLITIDVERLYQDAEKGVYDFLPILDEYSVKATFFLTCDVLTNCPDIAKDVLSCGHEVACHGFRHPGYPDNYTLPYLTDLPQDELDRELRMSRECFAQQQVNVKGFRSPAFRINKKILEVVGKHFAYDSSVVNGLIANRKYKRYPREPFKVNNLQILPISNLNILRMPLGSPYLLGFGPLVATALLNIFRTTNPAVVYFHSFDLVRLKGNLPSRYLDRKWYYQKCGPKRRSCFEGFLSFLVHKDCEFARCADYTECQK